MVAAIALAAALAGACSSSPVGSASPNPSATTAASAATASSPDESSPPSLACPSSADTSWPPDGYRSPAPSAFTLAQVSGLTVRLVNGTDREWFVLVQPWHSLRCVGWLPGIVLAQYDMRAGTSVTATVRDPQWGYPLHVGAALWDHACPDACATNLTGFIWLDIPTPAQ